MTTVEDLVQSAMDQAQINEGLERIRADPGEACLELYRVSRNEGLETAASLCQGSHSSIHPTTLAQLIRNLKE